MSKQDIGSTSVLGRIFIQDSSSAVGAGLPGLVFNSSGLTCYQSRDDDGNNGGTAIALVTATRGIWTSKGFVEKDATHMPGFYEVGFPNAAFIAGSRTVEFVFKGAANMVPCPIKFELNENLDCAAGTAQTGANTTITLASASSAVDNYYKGAVVVIISGTGANQTPRLITGYVGSTKVATVNEQWATNPDTSSVYRVLGYVKLS